MAIYKEYNHTIRITGENRNDEVINLEFQSYDKSVAKLVLDLYSENGLPINLTGATVHFLLVVDENQSIEILGTIEDLSAGKVSMEIPQQIKGYNGRVKCGVYIDFSDGSKIDVRNLVFDLEKSLIDNVDYMPIKGNLFQTFDLALTEIKNYMDNVKRDTVNYADTQKYAMLDKTNEVKAYGDNQKTQIGQVLPSVQAEVADLQSDLNDIKSNVVSIDALNTKVDSIDSRLTAEESNVSTLNAEVADLELYVGYTNSDIYGVEIDMTNKTFTRLSGAIGKNGGSDFDNINAYKRRRCILTNDGVVLAYYGESNYTESGLTTAEIVKNTVTYPIGTPVQVMVEQPKFYYKVVPLVVEPIANGKGYHMRKGRYYISDTPKTGFKVHPAFVRNGVERDKIYLSAYEGSIYDKSASAYLLNDEQVADFSTDMLSSIANAKPCSGLTQNLTRSNARLLAHNRGNGWEQQTIQTVSLTQLLFLIEYNTFNTQAILGAGATNKTDNTSTNMAENTGGTSSLGNASGAVTNSNGIQMVSYRGEENLYGNIWGFIDGINVMANGIHAAYVADHDFSDKQSAGSYADVGFTLAKTSGYVSAFGYSPAFDWLFLTSETTGNSSVPVGDYFWQNYVVTDDGGWRTILSGAGWGNSSSAGGFFQSVDYPTVSRYRFMSARLVYLGG